MTEQTFEDEPRWIELADAAWAHFKRSGPSVAAPPVPEFRPAIVALRELIAETVGPRTADWAVSNWMITRQPIGDAVREELKERRP